MTRIAELEKKYPGMPKDIILKWEMTNSGVRDSKDLDKASFWRDATDGSYISFDEELTLERLKKETPWRVNERALLLPDSLWTRTGIGFSLHRKENAPYMVREISEGKLALFEGDELVDVEVFANPRKPRQGPPLLTSKGTPVQDLLEVKRSCYTIVPVRFCEYFTDGEECKFCNFNPSQDDRRAVGINRAVTLNPDETAEAFKIASSEVRFLEGYLVSGGVKTVEMEGSINCKFVEKLNNALPYRTDMKLVAEAMPRRELLRLKEVGLAGIRFQMETFDDRLFSYLVPGKARHMSRERWLEAFQDAVDIFGVGNVAAKFVGGLTMQGLNGYKTWQEARDSHVEGDRWMISHGVFPSFGAIRWAPGSPISKDPANREKFPPTEFYLDVIAAHHAAMKEYGLYEKLNRFLYCSFCCLRSVYCGEMGMLEMDGDVGTYMSAVAPYEQNWIAQFLDSKKSPEKAE